MKRQRAFVNKNVLGFGTKPSRIESEKRGLDITSFEHCH